MPDAQLTDIQLAAALCEQVYRRDFLDQQLDDNDVAFGNSKATDIELSTDAIQSLRDAGIEKKDSSNLYYNDATGFVGRVVEGGIAFG